jgi:predicted DNA-binding protein (UPF0251 family)
LKNFKEVEVLKLDSTDIEFMSEEEGGSKNEIKCATLDKLVEQATNNTQIDHSK